MQVPSKGFARRLGLVGLCFAIGALSGAAPAAAQSLAEAAKKEGKVVVYGSLESGVMEEIEAAFTKKHGIKIDYFRASSNKTLDRVLTESRAGRTISDVVITNRGPMLLLKKEGIFAKYVSPESTNFPDDVKDPDGILSPIYRQVVVGILYNTKLVKPGEVPQSLEDLLKPEWKGKWVMPDPSRHFTTGVWVRNLEQLYGKDWLAFAGKLAAAKPILVESFIPSVQKVISGEARAGITYLKYVHIFGKEGAPLDYVRLPKMLADGHHVGIQAKAPHPNAARLFEDFFISAEGMKILAAEGEFVTAKGLYPPIKDADKVKALDMDELSRSEYKKWSADFRKLFVTR
ncbi:MAG: extracellular solute-binding protein [Betaproteobacteria bacterium]|nr:extracellular solute-binding protein [Betaproteobacteria bacterium]